MTTPGDPDVPLLAKPRLRGWLHAAWTPVVAVACAVLVTSAHTAASLWSCVAYSVTAVMLFATSAVYHLGNWKPSTARLLRRMDHANIFLVIAGSYTPLSVMLLRADQARLLLMLVWVMAVAGVIFKVSFPQAPRWLGVPIYLLLGWAALAYLPAFWHAGGPVVTGLIMAGGVLYSAGAVVYGLRRPDPSPVWFGFHEIFHAFTIAAFACHFAAIAMVTAGHY